MINFTDSKCLNGILCSQIKFRKEHVLFSFTYYHYNIANYCTDYVRHCGNVRINCHKNNFWLHKKLAWNATRLYCLQLAENIWDMIYSPNKQSCAHKFNYSCKTILSVLMNSKCTWIIHKSNHSVNRNIFAHTLPHIKKHTPAPINPRLHLHTHTFNTHQFWQRCCCFFTLYYKIKSWTLIAIKYLTIFRIIPRILCTFRNMSIMSKLFSYITVQ